MTVAQIRRTLASGAVALLVLVAALLGWQALRSRGFHIELPNRLGADISQTADGFTYSQSQKGHTLFTIHASKVVEHKGDEAELHDVTITLYGPEGSGRQDKIHGAQFSYDRKQGLARAEGEVSLDFAPPSRGQGAAAASGAIHVQAKGLVFDQATGNATTTQRVDFAFTQASGSAAGASYNAKSGVLVLDHEVALTANDPGGRSGSDAVIHAEHAQLVREAHQAYLIHPDSLYSGEHSVADQATLSFRPDGSAEQLDARGHVRLTSQDGSEVHSGTAVVAFDPAGRPTVAQLAGGLTYNSHHDGGAMQGVANAGTLTFAGGSGQGHVTQLVHARFQDAVSFVVQQHSYAGDPNGSSTRELRATRLDVEFAPGAMGRAEARRAVAQGSAGITLHDIPAKAPARMTDLSGDQLIATLVDGQTLQSIDGKGNTKIVDNAGQGPSTTSTGDALHLTFSSATSAASAAAAAGPGARSATSSAQLASAVQIGHVQIVQSAAGATPASGPLQASADQAAYQAGDQLLHLTGSPRLRNDSLEMTSDRVDYQRQTGDATAVGHVKASYRQGSAAPALGGDGPVHIVADHAQMTRADGLSLFYGAPGAPARIWQGVDSVDAPILALAKDAQTLEARGAHGDRPGAPAVHATLGASGRAVAGKAAGPGAPVRVASAWLRYSDRDRRAELNGGVTAVQQTGQVRSDQAQVYLTAAAPGASSSVDHIIADGHVLVTQPGRSGTGSRLVYTAADGRYVLTGTAHEPPRVTDQEKGSTTGAALIFRGADDSVEVSSQGAPTARTVTDTRTSK